MLKINTLGRSLKKNIKVIKIFKAYIGVHKLRKKSYLINACPYSKFDKFNKIGTVVSKGLNSGFLMRYFLNSFIMMWVRIAFRGKGFRIRNFQENLKLTLNFGHSHWDRVKFYQYWFFWKIKRQNYLLVTCTQDLLYYFRSMWPAIKTMNKYTIRGLRLRKQPIIRRFGKISQHISSLH